jgi:hypothetical protein
LKDVLLSYHIQTPKNGRIIFPKKFLNMLGTSQCESPKTSFKDALASYHVQTPKSGRVMFPKKLLNMLVTPKCIR